MRRHLVGFTLVVLGLGGLPGCGGGIPEGVPKNVDMSKDYTPAAKVDLIQPSDMPKKTASPGGAGGAVPPGLR